MATRSVRAYPTNVSVPVPAFNSDGSITFSSGATITGGLIVDSITAGGAPVTLPISVSNGGTGQTTAATAINALLPDQTSANGQYLTSNGSTASWGAISQQLKLISTTSPSNVSTVDVTVDPSKNYYVVYILTRHTWAAGLNWTLTFNSSGTNQRYDTNKNGDNVIYLSYKASPIAQAISGHFNINKSTLVTTNYYLNSVTGLNIGQGSGPAIDLTIIGGIDYTLLNQYTKFTIGNSGGVGFDGTIKLYEIVQ